MTAKLHISQVYTKYQVLFSLCYFLVFFITVTFVQSLTVLTYNYCCCLTVFICWCAAIYFVSYIQDLIQAKPHNWKCYTRKYLTIPQQNYIDGGNWINISWFWFLIRQPFVMHSIWLYCTLSVIWYLLQLISEQISRPYWVVYHHIWKQLLTLSNLYITIWTANTSNLYITIWTANTSNLYITIWTANTSNQISPYMEATANTNLYITIYGSNC